MFKGTNKATIREMVDALPTKLDMRSKVVFMNWLNDQENDCPHLYATGTGSRSSGGREATALKSYSGAPSLAGFVLFKLCPSPLG